jgi:hypothetical protein
MTNPTEELPSGFDYEFDEYITATFLEPPR